MGNVATSHFEQKIPWVLKGDIYIEIARFLYPDASEMELVEVYRPKVKKELLTYFNRASSQLPRAMRKLPAFS